MSEPHRKTIKRLGCCACPAPAPSDPHHLKILSERGAGMKATDKWLVPLCRRCHDEVERIGSRNENRWFRDRGIESAIDLSAALFAASPDVERMKLIVEAHREGGK